jgi:hypothetical protein
MDKLSELNLVSEDFIEYPNRAVQKIYKNNGIIPVFLGSNPSPEILKDGLITDKPRYKQLAERQNNVLDVEIEDKKFKE